MHSAAAGIGQYKKLYKVKAPELKEWVGCCSSLVQHLLLLPLVPVHQFYGQASWAAAFTVRTHALFSQERGAMKKECYGADGEAELVKVREAARQQGRWAAHTVRA